MKRLFTLIVLLGVTAFVVAGCNQSSSENGGTGTNSSSSTNASTAPANTNATK